MKNKKPDIGSIYVLSNPAMPGLLKIGFTQHPDTEKRVLELSKQTAAPMPFVLEFEQLIENPTQYERLIHARLSQHRVSLDKEFFRIDLDTAEKSIRKIVFGSESLDVKQELQNLVDLYKKYPDSFKKNDQVISVVESVLKGDVK